jgi:thioredoxin:protein disulfide reductase
MLRIIFLFLLSFFCLPNLASTTAPIKVGEVIQLSYQIKSPTLVSVKFVLHAQPEIYLYKKKLQFKLNGHPLKNVKLPQPTQYTQPSGKVVDVYTDTLTVPVTLLQSLCNAKSQTLEVGYQGCVKKGICYPPQKRQLGLTWPPDDALCQSSPGLGGLSHKVTNIGAHARSIVPHARHIVPVSNWWSLTANYSRVTGSFSKNYENFLSQDASFWSVVTAFFIAGLLLSLTPCVWPMIPVLSSIILGDRLAGRSGSRSRGFSLSVVYVLGAALAYALIGVVMSWVGLNLQAVLQLKVVSWLMAGIFFILGLVMMGLFQFAMPYRLMQRLSGLSERQQGGTFLGVFIMGLISALVVSPCISPPLAAALVYLAHKGSVLLGASALFTMGIGLGVPLVVLGTFGLSLLPRSGAWMNITKYIIGYLLIFVAIWISMSFLSVFWVSLLLAACFLSVAIVLMKAKSQQNRWLVYSFSILFGSLGLWLAVTSIMEQRQVTSDSLNSVASSTSGFRTVSTKNDLDKLLLNHKGKKVMIFFTADWCTECKVMGAKTFEDPAVKQQLQSYLLVKYDMTDSDAAMQVADLSVGPPSVVFLGSDHQQVGGTVYGYLGAKEMLSLLK